jgi:acyl-coenzyme A thioesterase PaaI-like protein
MAMHFKYKPTPDQLNERFKDNLGETLGIQITEVGDDYLKASMPVDHRTMQHWQKPWAALDHSFISMLQILIP